MKSLQAPKLKTIEPTKVICTAIRRYEEQALMILVRESEKRFLKINRCCPFQVKALLSRSNEMELKTPAI